MKRKDSQGFEALQRSRLVPVSNVGKLESLTLLDCLEPLQEYAITFSYSSTKWLLGSNTSQESLLGIKR